MFDKIYLNQKGKIQIERVEFFFPVMMLFSLIGGNQRFEGTYRLHLPGGSEE